MTRPRGTGSIFRMPGSRFLWICYYRNGQKFRENTHTEKEKEAQKFLQKRLSEVCTGNFIEPKTERVTISDLVEDLLVQFETGVIRGQKSAEWATRRWKLHVKPFFGNLRAVQVTSDLLHRYVKERQEGKASNATINRELALLRRAFQRGIESSPAKVRTIPPFPRLKENNARQGFLSDDGYSKLCDECARVGLWLRAMLAVGANFGWRKSEVLNLRVGQVNLQEKTIRLNAGETKNNAARIVAMTDEVFQLLAACVEGKQSEDFVFTRADGKRVLNFRKVWDNVTAAAGVPELIFHDLRRTGARNLRRLGVDQNVIMRVGGWKTASVFQRYNIVSTEDIIDAALRLDRKRAQFVQSTSIVEAVEESEEASVKMQVSH